MQAFDVSRSRRVVGVMERGESFVDVIQDLAAERGMACGWVTAVGAFEAADVQLYDGDARKLGGARLVKASDVVHLSGSISLEDGRPFADVYVVLARAGELVAGRLRGARVARVEFVVEAFEGVSLTRTRDAATGLSAWSTEGAVGVSEAPRRPVEAPGSAWAMAAAASESQKQAEVRVAAKRPLAVAAEPAFQPPPLPDKKRGAAVIDDYDEPVPEVGDWVAHKQFGLCKVEGEEEGGGLLIRLPSGVRKSLNLDYLRVLPATTSDGKRVFPLESRKR